MSTIVISKKGNEVCIAADTLTSFGDTKMLLDFSSREAIFKTFLALHPILKEQYFLNPKDSDDDPYESTQIDAVIANKHGIFGVYSLRDVNEFSQFWAVGSGADYALGAMYAVYENDNTSAGDIAEMGVKAGAAFNNATALPITKTIVELV